MVKIAGALAAMLDLLAVGTWDLAFPQIGGHTSKALDKNVVVRVILRGQCNLQRKEAK